MSTKDLYLYDTLYPKLNREYLLLGRYIMINQDCKRAYNTGCLYTVILLDRDIFIYEHRYGFNCGFRSNVNKKGILKTYVGAITPEDYSIIIKALINLIPSKYLNFFMYVDTLFVINHINTEALTSHACGYKIIYMPIDGSLGNNVYKIYIHKYANKKQWNNALRILNNYLPEEYKLPLLENKNE